MKRTLAHLNQHQEGFASLVIAIVLVLVLSLMTVGFAELMRGEERSALDRHLSSQAYYAAETGINDASEAISQGFTGVKDKCGYDVSMETTYPAAKYFKNSNVGDPNDDVSYSCLLIDPYPTNLQYAPLGIDGSTTTFVTGVDMNNPDPSNPKPIGTLIISWEDHASKDKGFVSDAGHPLKSLLDSSSDKWNSTGLVQLSLTPLLGTHVDRSYMEDHTINAFLYPRAIGGPITDAASQPEAHAAQAEGSQQGAIFDGGCNATSQPRKCNIRIEDLGQPEYLLNLRSIYAQNDVEISAYDTSGNPLRIANAQTLIDSTGKAQGVLRRVQVRLASKNDYNTPYGPLEVIDGICKKLQLMPAGSDNTSSRGTCTTD